jgi:hypothetical protein
MDIIYQIVSVLIVFCIFFGVIWVIIHVFKVAYKFTRPLRCTLGWHDWEQHDSSYISDRSTYERCANDKCQKKP